MIQSKRNTVQFRLYNMQEKASQIRGQKRQVKLLDGPYSTDEL